MTNNTYDVKKKYAVMTSLLFPDYYNMVETKKCYYIRVASPFLFHVVDTEDTSWFWTEEWQAGERKADEDYKEGRFESFNTIDEVISYLHAKKTEKESAEKSS